MSESLSVDESDDGVPNESVQATDVTAHSSGEDLPGEAGEVQSQEVAAEASVPQEVEAEVVDGSPKMLWYVLKVQSNREKSIRENLQRRIKRDGLDEYFGEITIPTEVVMETKGGKKKKVERKLYPGYIMIQMVLNEETWYLVRETSGVGDFTGAARQPQPMQDHEIARMLGSQSAKSTEPAKVKIDFQRGDTVKIKEGTFESFEGSVDAIDEASGRVTVLIEIFGRSTPVELEYWQVETV